MWARQTRRTKPGNRTHAAARQAARPLVADVARLFRRLGYRVHRQPATHDLGLDLVVSRRDHTAIVQCKDWRHPVGPAAVRDLYGTLLHTGADHGILITPSRISTSARQFTAGKPLLLMDGPLLRLLLDGLES